VVAAAIELSLRDQRLVRDPEGLLDAADVVIPVGAAEGWEAAVLDHFRAVATAIAQKAGGGRSSAPSDEVGGATLTFSLYRGHPHEAAVRALLSTVRAQVNALWHEATAQSATPPPGAEEFKVTFYFGQTVTGNDPDEAEG
jgi:hypothetical protein